MYTMNTGKKRIATAKTIIQLTPYMQAALLQDFEVWYHEPETGAAHLLIDHKVLLIDYKAWKEEPYND